MKDIKAKFKTSLEVKKHLENFDSETHISIILSKGSLYVEDEPTIIRNWESLVFEGYIKDYLKRSSYE